MERQTSPDDLLPVDAKTWTTEPLRPCAGGETGDTWHNACLCSLTRVTPPLVLVNQGVGGDDSRDNRWPGDQAGAGAVVGTYALATERIWSKGKDTVYPFGVGGIGACLLVLWVQGVHWSHSFPCSLKDAAFVAAKMVSSGGAVLRVRLRDWQASMTACFGLWDAIVST